MPDVRISNYERISRFPYEFFSDRQWEYLTLYQSGYIFKQIALMKQVNESIVRDTLLDARKKAGARTLTHLCSLVASTDAVISDGVEFTPALRDERGRP